jgi:predicted nuclease with TOPRIM domain
VEAAGKAAVVLAPRLNNLEAGYWEVKEKLMDAEFKNSELASAAERATGECERMKSRFKFMEEEVTEHR